MSFFLKLFQEPAESAVHWLVLSIKRKYPNYFNESDDMQDDRLTNNSNLNDPDIQGSISSQLSTSPINFVSEEVNFKPNCKESFIFNKTDEMTSVTARYTNIEYTLTKKFDKFGELYPYHEEFDKVGSILLLKKNMVAPDVGPVFHWSFCTTNSRKSHDKKSIYRHCFGVYACNKCDFKERPVRDMTTKKKRGAYQH